MIEQEHMLIGPSQDAGTPKKLTPITISCHCTPDSPDRTFSDLEQLSRWNGELFEVHTTVLAMCPECAHIREVEINCSDDSGEPHTLNVILGEILLEADDAASGTMRSFERAIEDSVGLDPDRIGICDVCDAQLYPEAKSCGPDAPEIGWEYYECPNCGNQMNPEVMPNV